MNTLKSNNKHRSGCRCNRWPIQRGNGSRTAWCGEQEYKKYFFIMQLCKMLCILAKRYASLQTAIILRKCKSSLLIAMQPCKMLCSIANCYAAFENAMQLSKMQCSFQKSDAAFKNPMQLSKMKIASQNEGMHCKMNTCFAKSMLPLPKRDLLLILKP